MTDEATTSSEAAPVSLPEIARQIAGFEGRVAQSLNAITQKLDGLESAAAAPVAAAEGMQIPPVAAANAPDGKAPGFLSGIAHTVAELERGAVGAVRSLAGPADEDDYPDGGVPVAPVARVAAAAAWSRNPIGSHTQAVEERRAQPAPALVDF